MMESELNTVLEINNKLNPAQKTPKGSNRIKFIDVAKGLGILLVIIGHISTVEISLKLIYSFHMPLFFFLAGLTASQSEGFVIRKVRSLMVPYYFWYFVFFVYWFFVERQFRDIQLDPNIPLYSGLFGLSKG